MAVLLLLFTALMAQAVLPLGFTPVPNTFALMGVYLTGAFLDKKWALFCQVCYVGLGLAGLPVFPGSVSGLHVISGPTGGYLLAYPLMAVLIAYGLERWGRGIFRLTLFMVLAQIFGYLIGGVQLLLITKAPLDAAWQMGVAPFLLPDFIQALASAVIAAVVDRVSRR